MEEKTWENSAAGCLLLARGSGTRRGTGWSGFGEEGKWRGEGEGGKGERRVGEVEGEEGGRDRGLREKESLIVEGIGKATAVV